MNGTIEIEILDHTPQVEAEIHFKGEVIRADADTLEREYAKGEQAGYAKGTADGYVDGWDKGYGTGKTDGYADGWDKGYDTGTADGYNNGYDTGTADGYNNGYGVGYTFGEVAGEKIEYNRFWDNFQQNGERNSYAYAFSGQGWNDEIFKPKYKFFTSNNYGFERMFSDHKGGITKITPDMFDYDRISSYYGSYMFYNADIKSIELSMRKNSSIAHMFRSCLAETIILNDWKAASNYDRTFESCYYLTHLRINGTIAGSNAFNLKDCGRLDAESITQVIGALSSTTSGKSIVFSLTAVNNAFETAEGLADGSTSAEWLDLVATKPNWTISLA